jgi:D-glycero-alpha-D-manno-heptose-7-phosphate kinase
MIIVKAPLRITFIGDATDLPGFCGLYQGKLISTTIDKYIYIVINDKYQSDNYVIKHGITEIVDTIGEIKHSRFRMALTELGIKNGMEIGVFSDLPGNTGLGSSSTFSVALIKALHKFLGKDTDAKSVAEEASRLEIELLKEPIGKQDQYAAAYGGFNRLQFNTNGSVDVEPVKTGKSEIKKLNDYSMLFFTGITRHASSILTEQIEKIKDNFDTYKKMADSTSEFEKALSDGYMKKIGELIDREWQWKKTLSSNVSNELIDRLYDTAKTAGALGGRLIGAGSGGCLFCLVEPEKRTAVSQALVEQAKKENLSGFVEVPIKFINKGAELIFNE